jgi:amino acid transporter
MALYTIMWNFIGWDSSTTYAEEVEKPVRTYLVSTLIAFVLVIFVYVITVVTAIRSGINLQVLQEQGFPVLGELTAGKWLGALMALGGMASTLGLFCAVLLSVSRVPEVMAEDHLLPEKLHVLHPRFKTPYLSIIFCALIVSFMILWTFGELLIIDITIYGAGLFLEYIALMVLRSREPSVARPFKIPLNKTGLALMLLIPVMVYGIALTGALSSGEHTWLPAIFAIILLLTAELLWRLLVWLRPHLVTAKKAE